MSDNLDMTPHLTLTPEADAAAAAAPAAPEAPTLTLDPGAAAQEAAPAQGESVLSEEERRRRKDANPYSTISYRIADELEKITSQEARVTVPGHYQRGGPACPYDRVLATRFGTAAARMIMEQKYGCMVGIQGGNIVHVPLEEAASRTKFLPVDHPLIQTARDAGTGFGD